MEKKQEQARIWEPGLIGQLAKESGAEHGPQTNPKIREMDEKIRALLTKRAQRRR